MVRTHKEQRLSHMLRTHERNNLAIFTASDVLVVGLDVTEYKYKNSLFPSNDVDVFKLAFFRNAALECLHLFPLELLTKTQNTRRG